MIDINQDENKINNGVIVNPVITVFGVGGAGSNAISNMISSGLQGVNFVVANTDAQALNNSLSEHRVQLGANITRGLGAGASPETGLKAAEEASDDIKRYLRGSNMVFVTAGMGGGTGTGASPLIAKIAREMGILTIGVVTKPFHFEGMHRMKIADQGLKELQKHVDTLIIIPNQNLFRIANESTTFADAFKMADEVLHSGVRCVTDLIIVPGLINLDFADIHTVMHNMKKAMMGTGEASGEDRAIIAANTAISNPLLDKTSIFGAKGVLINITGGMDMTLFEVDAAANRVREEVANPDANIIFGSTFDKDMQGMRVSVVATGIEDKEESSNNKKYHHNPQIGTDKIDESSYDITNPGYKLSSNPEISNLNKDLSESNKINMENKATDVSQKNRNTNYHYNNSENVKILKIDDTLSDNLDSKNSKEKSMYDIPAFLRRNR